MCAICFEFPIKPVVCKGPCHHLFCQECAANAKSKDKRCPYRCSDNLQVKVIPKSLRCPYKPEECTVSILKES